MLRAAPGPGGRDIWLRTEVRGEELAQPWPESGRQRQPAVLPSAGQAQTWTWRPPPGVPSTARSSTWALSLDPALWEGSVSAWAGSGPPASLVDIWGPKDPSACTHQAS